mgnify:CR=1 FL=1
MCFVKQNTNLINNNHSIYKYKSISIIMKVIIPVAGVGSRLKPHTHTVPKQLMDIAGVPMLEYVIKEVLKLKPKEVIFVVGHKKESITKYVNKHFPKLKKSFVEQKVRDGDGGAVRIGLQNQEKDDELLVVFGDTLVDFDLKKALKKPKCDALVFAMEVDTPEHYGVLNVRDNLKVYQLEEKPKKPKSNLAIIGAYYFKSLLDVKKTLEEINEKKEVEKGEYRIISVLKRYAKNKNKVVKASKVKKWFDCGRVDVLLEANRYFLSKNNKKKTTIVGDSIVISPSYISKSAKLEKAIIGPYASIGDNAKIKNAIIQNSIVNEETEVYSTILKDSLIGKNVLLKGKSTRVNLGENSELRLD